MNKTELIKYLKDTNPYPVDVFTEPSEDELKGIADALKEKGISSERVFAWFGRKVYAGVTERIEENLEPEHKPR